MTLRTMYLRPTGVFERQRDVIGILDRLVAPRSPWQNECVDGRSALSGTTTLITRSLWTKSLRTGRSNYTRTMRTGFGHTSRSPKTLPFIGQWEPTRDPHFGSLHHEYRT
jgi:hypothetical protein